MRIILSPAKQMTVDNDAVAHETLPVFLEQATDLAGYMRSLSYAEAKKLWGCNDKLAEQNYERFARMDLKRNLTPAVLAYDGIAFKYMKRISSAMRRSVCGSSPVFMGCCVLWTA